MNDPTITARAAEADEALRELCHHYIFRADVPAPEVYDLLGHLYSASSKIGQLSTHLTKGLRGSLTAAGYEVTDTDGDPAVTVEAAAEALDRAHLAAEQLYAALAEAQQAIASQGYTAHGQVGNR